MTAQIVWVPHGFALGLEAGIPSPYIGEATTDMSLTLSMSMSHSTMQGKRT